jgi:drug/metabolite transporter (DMT)-like permease
MTQTTRRLAAGSLAIVGLVHLILAPEYFSEQAYVGVLFGLGAAALFAFALRLWRDDDVPSWLLGALTMAGMGVGFVLSRTTGLPGFHESEWELSGVLCLVLEVGFVVVAARALAPGGDRRALTA